MAFRRDQATSAAIVIGWPSVGALRVISSVVRGVRSISQLMRKPSRLMFTVLAAKAIPLLCASRWLGRNAGPNSMILQLTGTTVVILGDVRFS